MNNLVNFNDDSVIEAARIERGTALADLSSKIIHAPTRLIKLGIDDFRRYRKPAHS